MGEERKQKEIEYYDKEAEKGSKEKRQKGDFEGFDPMVLASFSFFYDLLRKNCKDKKILDYGCGNGIHSAFPAREGAEKVIGIDLSEKYLEIARREMEEKGLSKKIEFLKMDCEKMDFPDDYFDIILDGGAFSSLDLNKAYSELARVLKPDGLLIGIETFGHNPLANLKRRINKITGKRTRWAADHIFQKSDLKNAENYFTETRIFYFHIISFLAIPFLSFPPGKFFLKLLESIDRFLFLFPPLKKYAFKVVFVFSQPKKYV